MTDQPCAPDSPLLQQYPQYFRPNIWPGPDLPDLEPAFKALGQAVVALGTQLAHHCDRYCCALNPGLAPGQLLGVLSASCTHKGRLLHYFPQGQPDSPAEPCPAQPTASQEDVGQADGAGSGPWQEGLTSAMFMRGPHVVACPDPAAGLYIRNRRGQVVQVAIPADHIAFQVGEALQVHSGGLLCATPHYVRGARGPGTADLARNTFAVFMQPDVAVPMDTPKDREELGSSLHRQV
ncbi:DIOX_N domain-containing protein [Haematococcus lacustris]|uniref:DIOX_N domain-containing protein n=1 Tax=Haematococcus lacustris TaxID=44745 RepID=A0A699YXW4_HAELA|nr:DIOX_N domain-containing protein [Haematococcus lacustris]